MAKIYLDAQNSEYTVSNDNDVVYGTTGDQAVSLAPAASGVVVDQNVEQVVFELASDAYLFLQNGNALKVYDAASHELISTIFVQGDDTGTLLTFQDGTAAAKLVGTTIELGGDVVDPLTASALSPELTGAPEVNQYFMTTGYDQITGTGNADQFWADIHDNTNTFQTGDRIYGGAGYDDLYAEIGDSQNFAIRARTDSVERAFFSAQTTDKNDHSDNYVTHPYNPELFSYNDVSHDRHTQIDAQDMNGVRELWSDDSRANLVIEDVREDSDQTIIGMRNTDPGDVNYEVYFDPQHITGPGEDSEGATLTLRLADVLDLADGGNGLSKLPYDGIYIKIGDTTQLVHIDLAAITNSGLDAYDALAAQLQTALGSNFSVEVGAPETAIFSITVTDAQHTHLQGDVGGVYKPITIHNLGPEAIDITGYELADNMQEPSGNIVRTATHDDPTTIPSLTQVDVILDNVARGDASGSGDLVIGDMSTSGIQQFNVQVDRSSHLDQMASTNNVLEVINVENIGAKGDLTINRIDDVRVFDASKMEGDVSLGAYLSGAVTEKYMNLQDEQPNPAGDNSETPYRDVVDTQFSYDMGKGDDTLDLAISAENWSTAGTTTREDFVLEINGNDGNDDITFSIVNGFGLARASFGEDLKGLLARGDAYADWYDNSVLNGNLTIHGGNGNDTISKPGSGDVKIYGDAGDDTIYSDNTGAYPVTGRKAVWVFNAAENHIDNLESDTNESYHIYKGTVTVDFKGFEVTVDLPSTNGVVSDLQVNQAIKKAINSDEVLNKMLEANDGPANTLVVTSKIDGNMIGDLSVTVDIPDHIDPADVTLLNSLYGTPGGTEASLLALMASELMDFNYRGDYQTIFAQGPLFNDAYYYGVNSVHTSDNVIEGGTGNDKIILGTGALSNETLVYNGFDQTADGLNDTDSIVNFDTTWYAAQTVLVDPGNATYETVTLTFTASDGDPAGQTITFDGQTIVLSAPADQGVIPAADIAYQFATQFGTANWEVTGYDTALGTVTITALTPGDKTDLSSTDFGGTYVTDGLGTVTPAVTLQGSILYAGTPSTFTVEFNEALTAANGLGDFNFAGVTTAYAEGDGGLTLAGKILANAAAYAAAGWTVAAYGDTGVQFTATTVGATAIGTAAEFDLGTNTIVGTISGIVGTADSTTLQYVTIPAGPGEGIDYIDFSSYDVAGVYVDGVLTAGVGAGANEKYIYMQESTTNDGEYTIYLYNAGTDGYDGIGVGTDDVKVGTIGVADFGVEQPFVAANFII